MSDIGRPSYQPGAGDGLARVEGDLPCAGCGYNLRTLLREGRCTECGRPVRHSVPPRGFRFGSRRSAARLRAGIVVLVSVELFNALRYIAIWLVCRFHYLGPAPWYRTSWQGWVYTGYAADLAAFIGVVLIAQPFASGCERFKRRLGLATVGLTLAGCLGATYGLLVNWRRIFAGTLSWGVAAPALVLGLCGAIAQVILWIHLLARVERARERALWLAICVCLCALALILCGDLLFNGSLVRDLATASPGMFFERSEFWRKLSAIASWWQDNGRPACRIAMLLALWLFLRRLNDALRAASSPMLDSQSLSEAALVNRT